MDNVIWTTLKAIFSVLLFFLHPQIQKNSNSCISDKYGPILTKHTSMESLFIQLSYNLNLKKCTLMTGFVVQGHVLCINEIVFVKHQILLRAAGWCHQRITVSACPGMTRSSLLFTTL